jgi:hypothetical protein
MVDRTLAPTCRSHAPGALDHALRRVLAEIHEGMLHGFFEYTLSCEIVTQERRRFTLRAGKSYQFVIPKDECVRSTAPHVDSSNGSDTDAT